MFPVAIYYICLLVLLRCFAVYSYRFLLHPLSKYPGPFVASISDWYGAFYALLKIQHVVTHRNHQKYGRVFRQGPNRLVFNSTAALRDIYHNDKVHKAHVYLVTQNDDSSVYSIFNALDKRLHAIKRKIVGPSLSERYLRRFEPTMLSHVDTFLRQLLKSSRVEETVDMTPKCKHLGLDIAGEFSFGYSFDMQTDDQNRFMTQGMEAGTYRSNVYMQFPLARYLGVDLLLLPALYSIRMKYAAVLKKMMKQRLEVGKHTKDDLFSFVVDAKDPETNTGISLPELWSEAEFFLPAGGHTTATTMAASLFYLSRNFSCYEKLAKEIRSTFTSGTDIVSGPKLSSCSYLRACIDESLRMSSPVAGTLWREVPAPMAKDPFVVDGHVIPKGTLVGVNTYAIHHNPEYFSEPFKFQPERWYKEAGDKMNGENEADKMSSARGKLMHDAFNPFSTGTRGCAGKHMAYMEIGIVLSKIFWYFDFKQPKDKAEARGPNMRKQEEFPTWDQLIAVHEGPQLQFFPRGDFWEDLVAD